MSTHTIHFLPADRSVHVDDGATIAEAAQQADVLITNLCGGEGVCGKCRVQVTKGRAPAESLAKGFFSQDQIMKGYVLACQTEIHDDLEIVVPAESRVDASKIMTGGESQAIGEMELNPIVKKAYLALAEPTAEDNVPDLERICRELRKELGWHKFDIPLDCLQTLSTKLRENDWKVTATIARHGENYRILRIDPFDTAQSHYGLAVDVGTTTVVAQLLDLNTGKVLDVQGCHNKQASFGEDVISRVIYACGKGGLDPVQQAVVQNINTLIARLVKKTGISRDEIEVIVAAGNTTMSHLLLGLTPCSIRLDPYVPTTDEFPQIRAAEIGIRINPRGILEVMPCVASYVGGDIVAGVLASGISEQEEVKCLIDIGTNGEIAIGNRDWLVCCSASAGPAFEGGGTRCGMRATDGAIEKVVIENGDLHYETIGNKKPRGICGSGLIDCIYELVRNNIIGQDGKFDRQRKDPRLSSEDGIPEYIVADAGETETAAHVVITESDIDNLIKSKGAVFAAIKSLIDYIGLGFDVIDTLYVAGGFGSFLNIPKAVAIGLLPDIPLEKIKFIGNSSLTGARSCLLSENAFETCLNISRSMTNIELSTYQPFTHEYIAALFLPHTDGKLFPSVTYGKG
ncbi:2Fe-2S iron-sulfur cluster binding domain protein [delta proteobacterium NaphS2]|nr:2Fe-2S iron-sulfur cluster binding domain protein [delta proteobacterium NaphS2]